MLNGKNAQHLNMDKIFCYLRVVYVGAEKRLYNS